jgi:hypothetical protein
LQFDTCTDIVHDPAFEGGPPLGAQRALGLVTPQSRNLATRVVAAVTIAWLPLVVLAPEATFVGDVAVHTRCLVAISALLLAEAECLPMLSLLAAHFLDAGLIADADRDCFVSAVTSTRRLLDSVAAEVALVAIVYVIIAAACLEAKGVDVPEWQRRGTTVTAAGWWHLLVSVPILLLLLGGWVYRLALWARFLWLMARLELRLVPSHPDRVGGLRFVVCCLRGFRLIALALGTIVAGTMANRVLYHGAGLADFRTPVLALFVVVLLLFALPLTVFMHRLRHTRAMAILGHGTVARSLGREFERRWLAGAAVDAGSLHVQDFSATTDLYSVVANVYAMRDLPFELKDLTPPFISVALPLVPVALFLVPMRTIFSALIRLLL